MNLLESVPEDWIKATVGKYCDVQLGKMLQNDPVSEQDELKPYLRAINISKTGVDLSHEFRMWIRPSELERFRLCAGDILVSEGGDAGRTAIFSSNDDYYFQNAINRLRPQSYSKILPEFIYYWFTFLKVSGYVEMVCNVATIAHFTAEKVKAAPLVLPPLKAQQRIAQFLDQKTAQIDGLIEKKRALLERLAEKRQALITQAVTKGLNPNAPMKPSGIDWLGDIPAHWEVKRLRFLLDGGTINGLYKPKEQFSPDGFAFVQMGEAFRAVTFDGGTKDRVLASDSEVKKWGLKEGDFLIARRSLVFEGSGKAVKINKLEENHLFESSMIRIRPISADKLSDFLSYYFQSSVCRAFFLSITKQVTISGIDSQQLKDVSVPMPPLDEAARIQQLCLESDQNHGVVTESILRSISQLNEYRAALITSAITGKLALD